MKKWFSLESNYKSCFIERYFILDEQNLLQYKINNLKEPVSTTPLLDSTFRFHNLEDNASAKEEELNAETKKES